MITLLGLYTSVGCSQELSRPPIKGASSSENYALGPETLVSANPNGGALRCEPSVGIAGDNLVVAWNDSWGGAHGSSTGTAVAWAFSRDAGKTFTFGGYLPEMTSNQAPAAADSQIVTDTQGDFYLEILSWQKASHVIFLYFMDHKEMGRWQRVTRAVAVDTAQGIFLDRPFLSIDDAGRLSLAFTKGSGKEQEIDVVFSRDRGITWSSPITVSSGPIRARGGASVARRGNRVLVSWFEGGDLNRAGELRVAESHDGGRSFQEPIVLYKENMPLGTLPGYVMGISPTALVSLSGYTCLTTTGGHEENQGFSLVSMDHRESGLGIVLFEWDGVKRVWAGPTPIGNAKRNGALFFPAILSLGGSVLIPHYFRDAPGSITDVVLSIREGNLGQELKLNSVSSDWTLVPGDKEHAPVQRNFGDYISIAASGRRIAVVWTDGRDGLPRIYCRMIEYSHH